MSIRRLSYSCVLVAIGVAMSPAQAENERALHNIHNSKKEPAGGQLDNGLISITKAMPPVTKVFDYQGDIWHRSAMLGDWGGLRTDLYNRGFTLDGQLTQVLQGVASGGSAAGNGGLRYNGLLEINATFDTAKFGLWSGGLFAATLQSSWGNPLSSETGNISPVNMTPMWPEPFNNSTVLTEFYLQQVLPRDIVAIVGRLDPTNFLDKNSLANNPESQFLNASLNNQLLWGEFLSFSTYAALLVVPATKGMKVAFGAWTPDTLSGDYDGDWSDYGLVVNPMWDYHAFGRPGAFQAVLTYKSADIIALDNSRLVPDLIVGDAPTKSGNWMVTFGGEQYLWEPEGASVSKAKGGRKEDFFLPTQDYVINRPGVGLFYRFAYTPEDRNPWNISISGGLGSRGLIPGRPYDRMGVGGYALFASGDLKDDPVIGDQLGDEVGFEAYYNFAVTPWMQVSADVQWISPGIKGSKDAVVLGSRLNLRF